MLARPPSLQNSFETYYSRDPAFEQRPKPPETGETPEYKKAAEAHDQKVKVARQTGNWSALLIEGRSPTRFVLRPVKGALARRLHDLITMGRMGNLEATSVAFRASIESVDFEDYKVKPVEHQDFGLLASIDVVNDMDAIDPGIVNELGGVALDRARGASPL